ncbi:C-type lectin domain family 7 member A-like isoform X1 [Aquila chrysaetos chrysaetos]|uniref:C-type lectin domain family 7 member A-like isoform X1 n=1 Tax=Aquila chrysaetos chrysaetos TaxID=223781 RepID=UPI001B7D4866|nr:C-type lectin domain family 7 member A-like isoform X1 [Aquila chrysaetos chrysaetos]XP_040985457.1 C-type lectin domain family 7 member A-like isoform X1 [Aquila chrysaetos chrysaetos]
MYQSETQQFTGRTTGHVVLCNVGAAGTKMRGSCSCCFSFFLSISDSPSPSPCWRLATAALGVFCLSSVVAAGVLATRFILVCHLVHERDENFTLQKAIMESLNQQLELLQAQNLNLTETVKQLATSRGHKCIPCPENWLQYGENCYHFSKEWKTWQESKAQCSTLESRLLKIESKEELDFTMRSAQSYSSYSFWIGLSHNGSEGPWLWEDGSAFSPDLFQIQRASSSPLLDCAWLQGANIDTARCGEYKFYICEKVVDPAVVEKVSYSDRH